LLAKIKEAPATLALCAIWVVVYVAMEQFHQALPAAIRNDPGSWMPVADLFGSQTPPEIYRGELWRTVTSTFIHFGILHLSVNILAMYQFGRMVEEWYGSALTLVFYLVVGFFGNLMAGLARPCVGSAFDYVIDGLNHVPGPLSAGLANWARSWLGTADNVHSAGGSSVICGWIGLIAVVGWRSRTRFGDFVRRQMVSLMVFTAILGLLLPFDNYGHACGALVGAALGFGHRPWLRLARTRGARLAGGIALVLMAACGVLQWRSTTVRLDRERARDHEIVAIGRSAENRQRVVVALRQTSLAYDRLAGFTAGRQASPAARRLGIATQTRWLGYCLGELDRLNPEIARGRTARSFRTWRGLIARALGKPPLGAEVQHCRTLARSLLDRAVSLWREADARWRGIIGPAAAPNPSDDRPARQPGPATVPRPARPPTERSDKVGNRDDRLRELAVIAADDLRLVAVARAGRPHRELRQEALGPAPGLGCHIVADQFQRIERRPMLGDQRPEVLLPAKRVRRDDRRVMPPDRLQKVAQLDARRCLVQIRQAVHQEMPLPRRDLRPSQNHEVTGQSPEIVQLVGFPLVIVLGDDHAIEPGCAGRFDQLLGVNHTVG
jgi:membrane associated rhomboid family serine protease